jgi:methylated-DNA-[protein]-cysteine S-methyltransferase
MDNALANISEIVSYTTYYHSPVGLLKISGTEHYISEVSFDKVQNQKAKKTYALMIQYLEQLIQYFRRKKSF